MWERILGFSPKRVCIFCCRCFWCFFGFLSISLAWHYPSQNANTPACFRRPVVHKPETPRAVFFFKLNNAQKRQGQAQKQRHSRKRMVKLDTEAKDSSPQMIFSAGCSLVTCCLFPLIFLVCIIPLKCVTMYMYAHALLRYALACVAERFDQRLNKGIYWQIEV